MKKTLIFIIILIIAMSVTVYASETEPSEESSLQTYLTERVAPIIAGVATSLVALMSTVSRVRSSLSGLDLTRKEIKELKEQAQNTLSNVQNDLADGIRCMERTASEIPEIKEGYEEIKESCLRLKEQNERLMEALKLGFESFPETVKCGNARRIAILTESLPEECEE